MRISLSRRAAKRPRNITEARSALQALKRAIDTGTFRKHGEGIAMTASTPLKDLIKRHHECVKSRALRSDYKVYAGLFVQEWGNEP